MRKWLKRIALGVGVLIAIGFAALGVGYWRSTNECESGDRKAPTNPMSPSLRRGLRVSFDP